MSPEFRSMVATLVISNMANAKLTVENIADEMERHVEIG